MSAYAALVSLLQNLGIILDAGNSWNIHNRGQLLSLYENVIFFLDFLDNSSTYKASQISALETKIGELAHTAEDLIESQISGILDSNCKRFRVLLVMTMINFFYSFVISRNWIHVSLPQIVPDWIKKFMLSIFIPALVAIVICTILAVVLNLALQESNFSEIDGSRAQETQDLRLVLYDLDLMVKEVVRIKEARGGMSASAALVSLRKIVDSVLESDGRRMYYNRARLKFLHEKATFLLDFLGNTSAKQPLQILEATITDAAYKAQQLIEIKIPSQLILDLKRRRFRRLMRFILSAVLSSVSASAISSAPPDWSLLLVAWIIAVVSFGVIAFGSSNAKVSTAVNNNEMLELAIDDLSNIVNDVTEIELMSNLPAAAATSSSSTRRDLGGIGRNVVVGLERDMEQIKARLIRDSSKLEVISIVGMGGIGKTTLARQVYNEPDIPYFFDTRAWVTISHEYALRHILLAILDSVKMILTEEERHEENDEKLALHLHKHLIGRRYLIVMDDVWDTEIWDFLSRFFPENLNGSRVLLTSRLSDVASYPDSGSPLHQMQCLKEDESWYLLCEKVFGAKGCPSELELIGREIARNCRGLPLAILVIGGLLYKDKRSIVWREVADNLSFKLRQIEDQCLDILGLSYSHLPHHLRPCFLYMGVFLGESEISVSRLISLWAAEGFLKPCTSKSLEEVGEDYLKDLIDRNLILVCKRSCNGKIKTCSIHDLLRDVCVGNASKENFFLVMDGGGCITRVRPEQTTRRLSIRPDALQVNARHDLKTAYYHVRSFLCIASDLVSNPSVVIDLGFPNLRVLDVLVVHFGEFPHEIVKLVRLRYLALHCDGALPPSMSKLHNLETMVHHHSSFNKYPLLPRVIWSMPNLRNLYVNPGCYLSDPLGYRLQWKSPILEHLQTLVGVRNFKWSKGIIKRIPNLKKLGISYEVSSDVDWSKYQLESLGDLHQLETLKILIKPPIRHHPPNLVFPKKLKKLTLSGSGIPWASIGALPELEALKLRCEACSGTWKTVEEAFPELVFLLLEQISFESWETDASHFPRLQRLVMRSCGMLEEIPYAIGEIPTLEMIELVDCHASAVDSLQEAQENIGNVDLKVCISLSSHIP